MNEDQMNDAARAIALEEAARICDDLTWAIDNAGQRYRREALASKCAEAIRERANVALATPAPAQPDPLHVANEWGEGEPVAWVRRHPDGSLTTELLPNAMIEPVRKTSGGWLPLYPLPAAPKEKP